MKEKVDVDVVESTESRELQQVAETSDANQMAPLLTRRNLLKGSIVTGAASLMPTLIQAAEPEHLTVPPWVKRQGDERGRAYGVPSSFEKDVVRGNLDRRTRSYTPLQHLHGIITPNGLFFERHHAGIPYFIQGDGPGDLYVCKEGEKCLGINPEKYRLVVHGFVNQAKLFDIEDLLRFPAVSRFHFVECGGNTDDEWEGPKGETVQKTHGLLSCCQWTGVPLSTLLEEVGLKPGAAWILAEGADGAAMTRSIPLDRSLDDCLIAYAQNGERLRAEQGYPIRLLVPGCEGNINVKWLRRLEISDKPFMTREETSKYTDLLTNTEDNLARQFTLLMETKSVITFPSPLEAGNNAPPLLKQSGYYEIRGLAWSGVGRIRQVDVSVDGGKNWQKARLDAPILPKCLTSFRLPWEWQQGQEQLLMSRAIDETGYVQPTCAQLVKARGIYSNYHYHAIHAWKVHNDGRVTKNV
jgi:sulfane dehydrogenase subunit SoxC